MTKTFIAVDMTTRDAERKLQSLQGQFRQSAQNIKSGFGDRVNSSLGRIHPELASLGSVLGKAGPIALGLTAIAAGTIGVVAAFNRWSEGIDRVAKQSTRLGVTESTLIGLRHAADQSGVSVQQMEQALTKLQKRSVMAAEGNKELARGFEAAGINLDTFLGLSPAEKMERLSDAIAGIEDPSERVRRSMQLLGDEAGVAMITMLENGGAALREYRREALELGLGLDSKTATQTQNFRDELDKASKALRGMANQFMIALAPAMEQVGRLIAWLARGFNTMVRPISDVVSWLISWRREAVTLDDVVDENSRQFNTKTKVDLQKEAELRRKATEAARKQREELEKFSAPTVAKMFEEAAAISGDLSFIRDAQVAKALDLEAREVERKILQLQNATPEEKKNVRFMAALMGVDPSAISDEAIEQEISRLGQRLGFLLRNQRAKFEQAQAALAAAEDEADSPGRRRRPSGKPDKPEKDPIMGGLTQADLDKAARQFERKKAMALVRAEEEATARETQRRENLGFAGRLNEDFDAALSVIGEKGTAMRTALAGVATQGTMVFANMGQSIASAFQTAFSGGDFGKALEQLIGQQLIAMGTSLVQAGTYTLALSALAAIPIIGTAFGGPPAAAMGAALAPVAIAAGVGMIAAGSAMGGSGGTTSTPAPARAGAGGGRQRGGFRSQSPRLGEDFGRGGGSDGRAPIIIQIAPGGIVGGDGRRVGRDVSRVLREANG